MKRYFMLLLIALFILPLMVFAEDENLDSTDGASDSKEVNVYLFRGEGCPHCQEAEEWFESIEEEYGSYFKVIDYETWYDQDNSELMEKVAEARGETAEGVPYIIVGNKSWNGFADSLKDEILEEIKSEYSKDVSDRYDIMKLLPEGKANTKSKKSNDVVSLLIIIVVVLGIGFGIYQARKKTV